MKFSLQFSETDIFIYPAQNIQQDK